MISGPASDEVLAVNAQGGCRASFEELLRRFQRPLLHFLRQRAPASEAEDLVQETFVRAAASLGQYRSRWAFATWIFTIARRVSINQGRRRRPMPGGTAVDSVVDRARGPMDEAAAKETRQQVWELAGRVLSEEQTTALWLYYVEELSVKEVAAVLGRTAVSVKVLMFRARKKLMPLLGRPASVCSDFRRDEKGTARFKGSGRFPRSAAVEVSDGSTI